MEAIQAKLQGDLPKDPAFLRDLIYSGAIDIYIDGLNEVTAEIRAAITQFVECYVKSNIILTTQPLEWTPPTTAKTYDLRPLDLQQIQTFLQACAQHLGMSSTETQTDFNSQQTRENYTKTCQTFLNKMLDPQQLPEELQAAQHILSNPMDLTIMAQMLMRGKEPHLFTLQQQYYDLMASQYQRQYLHRFPLQDFAEMTYHSRTENQEEIPADRFHNELHCMEEYKMVLSRQNQDSENPNGQIWYFRHDKIMEFFIAQMFLGQNEDLLLDHIGDSRFRGVYLLLAKLMPEDAAFHLREMLIQYAADSKDHTISDTFIQLLRSRQK